MREDHGPYHEGEIAVQELTGDRELAERHGGGIATSIMPGAWAFLSRQELLVFAAEADDGEVWISIWFGARGFAESGEEGRTLYVDRAKIAPLEVDPFGDLLREGAPVGVLAIELETRKRLRVNGSVRSFDAGHLQVAVREAFPNCPKYITRRHLAPPGESSSAASLAHGTELDTPRIATIRRADTLFVGSLHPERGADASHRGGDPGFVQVLDAHTLQIPDYAGNGMYQTLGNLHTTPRAGLVFLDFDGRRLLHVTGTTKLHFAEPQLFLLTETPALVTGGTGRSWSLHVERWVEGALPASIGAELLDRSRFNPKV